MAFSHFQHSQRNFYDMEGNLKSSGNGYLLLPMDRHSHPDYLKDEIPLMAKAESNKERCEQELFCGMPFYTARMLKQSTYSFWIPAQAPYFNADISFRRITNAQPADRMLFEVSGTSAMDVFLSPMPGVEIERWSFFNEVTDSGMEFQGRPTYFVMYSTGSPGPATFWIDLKVPSGWTGKKLDIGIVAHYTHFDKERTPEFQEFVNSYPKWCHVTAWMGRYNGYEV